MKCINKILALLTAVSILFLWGCGSEELPLDYTVARSGFEEGFESKVGSFSAGYAIVNADIPGSLAIELEESQAAGLFSIKTKEALFARDVHARMSPASITKVMTALIALKNCSMDEVITCSSNVTNIEAGATTMGLKAGDQLTMNQALHALLMKSANDVAIAIGEHIAGSTEEFCDMMNKEALRLGATNTNFTNPHGLTDNNHYTTVYDLYLITQEAVKYALFNEIINTTEYVTTYNDALGNEKSLELATTNMFLRGSFAPPENIVVIGGKTGTTYAAGNCLDFIVKDSAGNVYIAIILKASQRDLVNQQMQELLKEIKK